MSPYQTKLGHAHLKVRDLKRSVDFYTRFFDLAVVEQVGGALRVPLRRPGAP